MNRFLTLACIAIALMSCSNATETYTVTEQPLNEAVYASGEIMPGEYHFLRSAHAERIMKFLKKEGDSVRKGDLLVLLGTPSDNTQQNILSSQVSLASQNAGESSAALKELEGRIALAKKQYDHDLANAEKYNELVKTKAVSEKDAQQFRLQADNSITAYRNLQQQYTTEKNTLKNKLLEAEQQLAIHRQSREGKALASPISGKVYSVNYEEGELAQPESPILLLGYSGAFKLELLVDERDISKIKTGQKVFFETDAFAGKQFKAAINKIIPVLQKENRSFKVEATVLSGENFYPQSSVEANILIREKARGLMIPSAYLLKGDTVLVNEEKIKVTTGMRNGDWVEVKQGLKAGDVLTKNK